MRAPSQEAPARLRQRLARLIPRVAAAVVSRRAREALVEEVQNRAMQTLLDLTRVTNDGGFRAQRARAAGGVQGAGLETGSSQPQASGLEPADSTADVPPQF